MDEPTPPRSRAARSASIARLAGEHAARNAATKAANLVRPPQERRLAVERRHIQAVNQMVMVLGTMKGIAMKFGQMLSMLDLGFLPEAEREQLQRRLAALYDSAPHVPFAEMRRHLEREIGPVERAFAELDPHPIAAASIGQVFRARLHDGRAVAVKIQYPGIATAVRADLKNLHLFVRLAKPIAPGVDLEALAEEQRGRMLEEIDYRLEAANQRAAAQLYAGHPFIFIPGVVDELSGERVLVTELVEGRRSREVEAAGEEVRNRVGEILFRFYAGGMYRLGQFSGDPHPGNYILRPDGSVAFLDFGLYKRMTPAAYGLQRETFRAGLSGDHEAVWRLLTDAGVISDVGHFDRGVMVEFMHTSWGWCLYDREVEITPELANRVLAAATDPRSEFFPMVRYQHLPPEHFLARRTEAFLLGALGRLRARANWHLVIREMMFDDPPRTELGRREGGFYASLSPVVGAPPAGG